MALKVLGEDGATLQYRAFPRSEVKLLFPTGEAILEPDSSPDKWKSPSPDILKKAQIAKVYDLKRRFNVVGVSLGDQLFVFDELFGSKNSVAMSVLMRATGAAPTNGAGALDLVRLYLALSYYRLGDPEQCIAYKSSESEKKHAAEDTKSFADWIGLLHSPEVVREEATYSLDFFTYDAPGMSTKISHWKIDVGARNLKERLSEHHIGFHERYPKKSSDNPETNEEVHFSVAMMGDGFTDDGARTDLQFWEASDGPGVQRTHYYYKSHEAAEKRMQDFLEKAVAIVETRPWLDSNGKDKGTQALVIRSDDSKKVLYASRLFEDETSVLELSCASLSNLGAIQNRQHPKKPQ